MVDFVVAIPARYAASRLPGKPLRLIDGVPLIVHVARRALSAGATEVAVAADDERIAQALDETGVKVYMTSSDHQSGTDRLAETAALAGWSDDQIVVNLQGDEPFAPVEGIRRVAALLAETDAPMGTLSTVIDDVDQLFDPNSVKVVANDRGEAMLFSRSPIPWSRDTFGVASVLPRDLIGLWQRHIGIYSYRVGFLKQFAQMPQGLLEKVESLEQLRVMQAGFRIAVAQTPAEFPPGVDTPEDLERAERFFQSMQA